MSVEPERADEQGADELDEALAAFWSGDARGLSELVPGDADEATQDSDLFEGLRGAEPIIGLALRPGDRFEQFTIIREIGRGGMGVVFSARQRRPERDVAIKLMRSGFMSQRLLRRFEHEIDLLGRLQHPGIAQIYDAGQAATPHGMQPYVIMELIRGQSLLSYVRDSGISIDARMRLFARICDAVEHAHQKGIIHRDLKPANILV